MKTPNDTAIAGFDDVYGGAMPDSPLEWVNIELIVHGSARWGRETCLLYQKMRGNMLDGGRWYTGRKVW